jgi:hypothetical protein
VNWVRFATDRTQLLGRQQVTGRTAKGIRDCRHGMRPSAAIDEQQNAMSSVLPWLTNSRPSLVSVHCRIRLAGIFDNTDRVLLDLFRFPLHLLPTRED